MGVPENLLKSNSITDIFEAAADISSSSGDAFTMKVTKFDLDIQTPLVDATQETLAFMTGSYSDAHIEKYTGRVTGRAAFKGYIIENRAMGLAGLPNEEVDVEVVIGKVVEGSDAGNKHKLVFRMAIENIKINWARTSVGIPVVMAGKIVSTIAETIAS